MTQNLLILAFIFGFIVPTVTLQCWNCVGTDCGTYSSTSKNWELTTCPEGSLCQKTDFAYYSNAQNTTLDGYTVRSCSYEKGCVWERSKNCMKNPVELAGRGCVDRFCCGKDKCNASRGFSIFIVFILVFCLF